jgi:hypothetical protein
MSEPHKPRNTRPGGAEAPDEITAPNEISPELLSKLRHDENDRVTERRRIIVGPDGLPRVLDLVDEEEDEHEQTTRRIPATRADK